MTEDHKQLLAVFETKVRYLMALCDEQKRKINELNELLLQKDQEIARQLQEKKDLKTKCDNMLTARVVSVNPDELKSAKMRLSKLVREVDKCIALLNE